MIENGKSVPQEDPIVSPEVKEEPREVLRKKIETYLKENHIPPVQAKELLEKVSEACVDGRRIEGAIGTPGGNAGEFLLMMMAQFGEYADSLQLVDVRFYLENYLAVNGTFYFHTDEGAMGDISADVLKNPTDEEREELLPKLVTAEHFGCGHLKKCLQFPDEYGVSKSLVEKIIKAIYLRMWDRNRMMTKAQTPEEKATIEEGRKIDFEILRGKHDENAVVIVKRVDEEGNILQALNDESMVPMIPPHSHDGQSNLSFFVSHPKAKEYIRGTLIKRANEIFPEEMIRENKSFFPEWGVKEDRLTERMIELGNRYSAQTLARLAVDKDSGKGFPIFWAAYDEKGKFIGLRDRNDNVKTLQELEKEAA